MQHFFRGGRFYGLGLCAAVRAPPFAPLAWAWSSSDFGLLPAPAVGGGRLSHFSFDGAPSLPHTVTFNAILFIVTSTDHVSHYTVPDYYQPHSYTSTHHVGTTPTVHWKLPRATLERQGIPRL